MPTISKTTLTGLLGAAASIVAVFGFAVPQEVVNAIVIVTMFLIGLFAKDAKAPFE